MQYINKTGFRACVKELYEAKYDPLSVTYTVLSGKSSTASKLINFSTYKSLNKKKKKNTSNTQKECTKTGGYKKKLHSGDDEKQRSSLFPNTY